jgi:uncharacterized protein (DUF433 family)
LQRHHRGYGRPTARPNQPVSAMLGQLAAGPTLHEVLEDSPQLERENVGAAPEFAAADTNKRMIALPRSE